MVRSGARDRVGENGAARETPTEDDISFWSARGSSSHLDCTASTLEKINNRALSLSRSVVAVACHTAAAASLGAALRACLVA